MLCASFFCFDLRVDVSGSWGWSGFGFDRPFGKDIFETKAKAKTGPMLVLF